ncbi:29 kDa ribonucleoprotein A, chloroplastic-like [Papaver somniferum]|uniref:29 kDa ribonucleoprotein A, chloroplastic-like n=1 Tax=Papaver somniferum TaxID=3469 RepID=UPI000E7052B6|nr:29 kDa ribonucleoprotein A, chloroplastic-like [Papaver somniferum]
MTKHQERISSCLKLIGIVNHYIKGLRLRLGILKKEAVKAAVTSESEEEEEAVVRNLSLDLRLFLDNLPFNINIAEVVGCGNVQMVRFFCDNPTLRSSGFAFVTMSSAAEARDAVQKLNGLRIGGRTIRVNY